MAAKKPVKKAVAKAPAKKVSAPAKKTAAKKPGMDIDLDRFSDEYMDNTRGPLGLPRASSPKPSKKETRAANKEYKKKYTVTTRQYNKLMKAPINQTPGRIGSAAPSRGRGSGSSPMSRTFGRLGGGLRGLGK